MKINTYITLSIPLFLMSACQKDEVLSRPVDFSAASYQALGSYDSLGKPNYLLTRDKVSPDMIIYLKSTLTEKSDVRETHPELLTNNTPADIAITQSSDVFITFTYQNTVYANALAFYTYPTNTPPTTGKDIKSITYIFPNAGAGTPLKPGDKVNIGRFEPGTSIGFVVLKGAWNANTKTLDSKVEHFCSSDILNPEIDTKLKKHSVMLNYATENKTLICLENTDRTSDKCDNDFNDVVFYVTSTPL
ncbi:DUF4114 domain-containing protein [Chitinophagaceae bacterium LB-8]|uniref:DUF4114 domain-containing protein n=1 Tax=Paraflavisolibacter caeni TaxID=2982496 RepID=A0A9X2XQ29_9BACT|nr:DUF4114 domain-containing protein [Paraflavisolibacter caeni]MCU7552823.1 DUF4114 domain-containing protein [Paraflavisolibacter caeni]